MPFVLRVDVDKPYGRKNLATKIASKLLEDYWFPRFIARRFYLAHLKRFLEYCNAMGIKGHIYHRLCTVPNETIVKLLTEGGHKLGFHAENTRSYDSFFKELTDFTNKVASAQVDSFTKHGSGELKLGKHHYAPYEPEKYKAWAATSGIAFYFGNGICMQKSDFNSVDGFYPSMFWIEPEYRGGEFKSISDIISIAKESRVIVLIHPSNYDASAVVAGEFKMLVDISKQEGISWELI